MTSERPSLPSSDELRHCKIDVYAEIHAGEQSRVLDALLDGRRSVIKLTESRLVDIDVLALRMQAVETLAALHPSIVAPTRVEGELVWALDDWLLTATPFITGHALSDNVADSERFGSALADLHLAMRRLDPFDIPAIASLDPSAVNDDWQLLHGDFSTQNVLATTNALRIFDFDDCGYGPTTYDVANSLYMVMFDADVTKRPERYEMFRPAFLAGYAASSNRRILDDDIDDMIALRIDALGRWLDDVSTAPIGIRTSSPEWQEVLAAFVTAHRPRSDK